jgi:hypothetical protein
VLKADKLTTYTCQLSSNLEPSEPVQACAGIDLPFLFPIEMQETVLRHLFFFTSPSL